MRVRIKRVRPSAILPRYATRGAVGMDLHAAIDRPITVPRGLAHYSHWSGEHLLDLVKVVVPTGIAIELPDGYEAQVRPRSGLAAKHGITVLNTPGTIDADYRGEIKVLLVNLGNAPFVIDPGMRIAQLVIAPVVRVEWDEVDELSGTARGTGGFGSTGM